MTPFKRLRQLSEIAATGLVAVAMADLALPSRLLAQTVPEFTAAAGPVADVRLQVDVTEMDAASGLPKRFSGATESGQRLSFELLAGGYAWSDEASPELKGFRALPDIRDVATWKIDRDAAGAWRASLPLPGFPGAAAATEASAPRLEVVGAFDAANRSVAVGGVGPKGERVEMNVSFANVPGELAFLQGSDAPTPLAWPIIIITLEALLILLGVAFILCVAMSAACWAGCGMMCYPRGVRQVITAVCGVGCTCECNP